MRITKLKHHLLIAMPWLEDPGFAKSVVYVLEHNTLGTMGLIVNKPLPFKLNDVMSQLNIETNIESVAEVNVHIGGPLGQEQGFILYEKNQQVEVSTSKYYLEKLAAGDGPEHYLVLLGYASWGDGQLEEEIKNNDWLIVPPAFVDNILFKVPLHQRWVMAAKHIGVDIQQLTQQVGHA